ncbi:hypothetical protein KUTeg_011162 [Tegillarca granosa]|uniref:39S ribosomal protein L55, mitochondrial n=1 Tax=Tegillarca granosa TaxID=220873 RepID=A0ABQ9F1K1_TEGGR|nr:hypothetical protein KUTeg_011162 [Tegillarca granosa]
MATVNSRSEFIHFLALDSITITNATQFLGDVTDLGSLLKKHIVETCKCFVRYNSNRTGIAQINRVYFKRTYPTMLVLPNGATINIRYKEPRQIIKLPLDIATLSPEERALRLQKRKPKVKREKIVDIGDDFDRKKYMSSLFINKFTTSPTIISSLRHQSLLSLLSINITFNIINPETLRGAKVRNLPFEK